MDALFFHTPSKFFLEAESSHKIGSIVKYVGQRPLFLTIQSEFKNADEFSILKTSLDKHSQGCILYDDIINTPSMEEVNTASFFMKRSQCDCIVSYGSWETFGLARMLALL